MPSQIHRIFKVHPIFVLIKLIKQRRHKITHETNTLHKPDRADNPQTTVYKIYEVMMTIVIKVKTLLASSLRCTELLGYTPLTQVQQTNPRLFCYPSRVT